MLRQGMLVASGAREVLTLRLAADAG